MKLKDSVIIEKVGKDFVLVDSDPSDERFNGLVTMNEISKEICEILLKKDCSKEEIVGVLFNEYEAEKDELEKDVEEIIEKLKEAKIII